MSPIDTNKLTPLPTQGREDSPIAECRWYNAGQQAHSHSHRICNGCELGNRSGMLLRVTDRPVIIHSDGRKFYGHVVRSAGNRALTIEDHCCADVVQNQGSRAWHAASAGYRNGRRSALSDRSVRGGGRPAIFVTGFCTAPRPPSPPRRRVSGGWRMSAT